MKRFSKAPVLLARYSTGPRRSGPGYLLVVAGKTMQHGLARASVIPKPRPMLGRFGLYLYLYIPWRGVVPALHEERDYIDRYDLCPRPTADELVSSMQARSRAHAVFQWERQGANRSKKIAELQADIDATRARVLAARDAMAAYGYRGWNPI